MIGKIFHIGKNLRKQVIGEQVLFVPNIVGGLGGVATLGMFCNFYPH